MPSKKDDDISILKKAVETYEVIQGEKIIKSVETIKIIRILETFLKKKGLMCYGGIALNNILPKSSQFYEDHEMPDYDVYSNNPVDDIKDITDMYYEEGYDNCYASSNPIHLGSYKLFVNYMAVLDVTHVPDALYKSLYIDRITVDGICYTPVNFLRRSIYNELSNPEGDVARFEKVYSRLLLVNKYYPVATHTTYLPSTEEPSKASSMARNLLIHAVIDYGGVFFGGFAMSFYAKYLPSAIKKYLANHKQLIYAFASDPKNVIHGISNHPDADNVKVSFVKHSAVGDIVNVHYEVIIDGKTAGVIFEPIGCHSYNVIRREKKYIKIATIFNILHMYYTFIYLRAPYYNTKLLTVLSECLYHIKQSSNGKEVLNSYPITCYGQQETRESMFQHRTKLYAELKESNDVKKLERYFLKYAPGKTPSKQDSISINSKEIFPDSGKQENQSVSLLSDKNTQPPNRRRRSNSKTVKRISSDIGKDSIDIANNGRKVTRSKSKSKSNGSWYTSTESDSFKELPLQKYSKTKKSGIFNIYRK